MPSMIQSYVNLMQQRQNNSPYYTQDAWRTHVKAYAPKGKLLKPDRIGLVSAIKSDAQSLRYFADGINGKGNDYSIGKINDVAIKLGGLGIAGMLASSVGSPLKKGMEFIGLACWLAAMSLWPKLAINAPIKHFKGVDLDLEYKNSAGNKKNFYADPQFLCWDLFSDKQIHEMGDKLGVPRNIHNRRKAIENKARQVSIQGNTLTTLTAGFATPLIASLAADQIGKRAYVPFLEKMRALKATALREEMLVNNVGLIEDANTMKVIDANVQDIMPMEAKNEIKAFFNKKTEDVSLKKVLNEAIDNIFDNANVKSKVIYIDEKVPTYIARKITDNGASEKIETAIIALVRKFGNSLNDSNFNEYMAQVEKIIMEEGKIADSKKIKAIVKDVEKMLKSKEILQLSSVQVTKDKLTNLAKLLDTYNVKIHQDFNQYMKYTIIGDSSVNANVWEQASDALMKTLKLDKATKNALANAPSLEHANQILGKVVDNIIANPEKYEDVIRKLGATAEKLNLKNENAVHFSLKYLDKLQTILNAYEKSGEIASVSEQLNKIIANQRKEILGKYMSTNNTIFAPIRTLSILKEAKANKNIDYNVLKELLFNSQTAETFINKLDNYKNVIKNVDDYKKYMNFVFGDLPASAKDLLPEKLASTINENTKIMKVMLNSLSDDVNIKFPVSSGQEVVATLKNSKFANYIDEYFTIYFNNPYGIADKIVAKAKSMPEKLDELKGFLKLSSDDIAKIKNHDYTPIKQALLGSKKGGPGYLENGRHRFKNIMQILDAKSIDDLGEIYVQNSKICKVTSLEGRSFGAFAKDSAKKAFVYQGWLKKVGLSLVALCALTGFALTRIGKKNEFNPDIYRKREAA